MSGTVQTTDAPHPSSAPSTWALLTRALSPIEDCPRLVASIEMARHVARDGSPYVIIHNTEAHTYLRLEPTEVDILPLMDGTRSIKALVVAYYQRNGVLALPRIARLVQLLRANRFLAEPPLHAYSALRRQMRGGSTGLRATRATRAFVQTEWSWQGLDARLGAWYRAWGHWFFTPPVVLIGTCLGLLAPVLMWREFGIGRYDALTPVGSRLIGTALLIGFLAVALAAHELGHAFAVKHAGRSVHRAGLMLYYGFPAAFVDTTDIWLAPPKMRLLASFAGPWTGLAIGGACALAVALLPPGPVPGLLFTLGFVCLVNNLMNFNPLLELDGYYLLVDLLEKPLLRVRALAFVRGRLWTKLRYRQRFSREEVFFTFFGLASAGYSYFAILLALRFWELRLLPMVRGALASSDLVARSTTLVLAALVATPVLMTLWALVRRVGRWMRVQVVRVAYRATVRRRREAVKALRAVPLWAALPEARLVEIAAAMRAENVTAGAEVVRQGEPGDRLYVVASGTFDVIQDGRQVRRITPADYFGELALLNDAPRNATVIALESARLFSLDRPSFEALVRDDLIAWSSLRAALLYRAQVGSMPLFRDLSPRELDSLLARLVRVDAESGAEIIRQGEPGDRFYIVRSGRTQAIEDGRVVREFGPGDAFGEMALLLDVPRLATVRALEPTELLALEARDFRDLLLAYCDRLAVLGALVHSRLGSDHRLDHLVTA
jgi:CRP-like cAMP-binding protein